MGMLEHHPGDFSMQPKPRAPASTPSITSYATPGKLQGYLHPHGVDRQVHERQMLSEPLTQYLMGGGHSSSGRERA